MSLEKTATQETREKREIKTQVYAIASEFCRTLYPPVHELNPQQSLRENGVDSFDSADLVFEIEHRLKVELDPLMKKITEMHHLPDKREGNYSELSLFAIAEYLESQAKQSA